MASVTPAERFVVNLDEANNLADLRSKLIAWGGLHGIQQSDRDDLVHDTIQILLQDDRVRTWSPEETVRYALVVLRNKRAWYFRRLYAERRANQGYFENREAASDSEFLSEDERKAILQTVLSTMSQRDRKILELYLKGKNLKQVADEMAMTHSATRQAFVRALDRLVKAYFGPPGQL